MNKSSYRTWFLLALIVSLLTLLVLVISEIYLAGVFKTHGQDFANDKRRYINLRELTPSTVNRAMIVVDGEFRTNKISTDENGFIEPSIFHDDPEFKLAFFGGSTTAGINIEAENKYPYLVGRQLESLTGRRINSINASRSANNAMHSNINFLVKIMKFRPDIVVMMHNINDLILLSSVGSYWSENAGKHRLILNFSDTRYSRDWSLLQTIKNMLIPYTWNFVMTRLRAVPTVYKEIYPRPIGPPIEGWEDYPISEKDKVIAKNFAEALTVFINIAKSFGVVPVLMTQPIRRPNAKPTSSDDAILQTKRNLAMHAYLNVVIRELGIQKNVLVIDLETFFISRSDRTKLFYDMVHYTNAGSRLIAEQVTKQLLPFLQQ